MRTLRILLLSAAVGYIAYSASSITQIWAVPPIFAAGSVTIQTLSASTNWTAIALLPRANHTLSAVRVMVGAVSGTLNAGDLDLEVYTDNGSGKPSAPLGGGCASTTVTTLPTGALFVEWTGLSCPLTRGTPYYLVVKNLNGSPASNNFSLRGGAGNTAHPNAGTVGQTVGGNVYLTTTNSGTAWTLVSNQLPFYRVAYSDDSSYSGFPITQIIGSDPTNLIYAGREFGSAFTSPAVALKAAGIGMNVVSTSGSYTPTGSLHFGLWAGSAGTLSNLGYTNGIAPSSTATVSFVVAWFASPVTIPANTTIRVVAGEETNADASNRNYKLGLVTIDNDVNSRATMPFHGTLQATYCTGICSTAGNWTQANTGYYGFVLYLDPDGEFSAPSGSSVSSHPIVGRLSFPNLFNKRGSWL